MLSNAAWRIATVSAAPQLNPRNEGVCWYDNAGGTTKSRSRNVSLLQCWDKMQVRVRLSVWCKCSSCGVDCGVWRVECQCWPPLLMLLTATAGLGDVTTGQPHHTSSSYISRRPLLTQIKLSFILYQIHTYFLRYKLHHFKSSLSFNKFTYFFIFFFSMAFRR